MRRDDPDIGGHPVSELDIDDVTDHQLLGVYVQLLSVTDNQRELKPHSYVTIINSEWSKLLRNPNEFSGQIDQKIGSKFPEKKIAWICVFLRVIRIIF